MHWSFVLLDTVTIFPWDQLIEKYGLAAAEAIIVAGAMMTGKLRTEREVVRERELADSKDVLITSLADELKETTVTIGRLADGLEERNRIERELRGRRT